jgi:hypothetical protein
MARRICSAFLSATLLQGVIAAEIDPDSVNVPVTRTKGTLVHLVVPIRWSNHHDRLLPGLGQLNTVLNNNGMVAGRVWIPCYPVGAQRIPVQPDFKMDVRHMWN